MDEHGPETHAGDAPTPPAHPTTALAASTPLSAYSPPVSRVPARWGGLRGVVESTLDTLDALADGIAGVVGLR